MGRFVLLTMLVAVGPLLVSSRNPKWFFNGGTVTNVVAQRMFVTSLVPSSCVVIDPSLPTCRNVRRMGIAPAKPTKILATTAPDLSGPRSLELEGGEAAETERGVGGSSWGGMGSWGSGWARTTVTKTQVTTQTVRALDPDQVVSIVFKGCQPTSLPFSLQPCGEEAANATQQIQRELHYTLE